MRRQSLRHSFTPSLQETGAVSTPRCTRLRSLSCGGWVLTCAWVPNPRQVSQSLSNNLPTRPATTHSPRRRFMCVPTLVHPVARFA
jgi:hypothetical protein